MKKSILSSIILVVLVLSACQSSEKKPLPGKIHELKWLLGRWEDGSDEGLLVETWSELNDSTYTAATYFTAGPDTLFSENIRVEEHHDGVFYIPTVKDQNGGKPVTFELTYISANKAVFENPKHDYPKKLVYTLSQEAITATISGNGKQETFTMGRSD